jgi:hypothetical protein
MFGWRHGGLHNQKSQGIMEQKLIIKKKKGGSTKPYDFEMGVVLVGRTTKLIQHQ